MSQDHLRLRLQEVLGSAFTLERELPRGGMSHVFAATENAFGRKVVIKVLSPDGRIDKAWIANGLALAARAWDMPDLAKADAAPFQWRVS